MAVLACALLLSGCAGTVGDNMRATHETYQEAQRSVTAAVTPPKPVTLEKTTDAVIASNALTAAEELEVKGAIERHARLHNESTGSYVIAGADLNGDRRAEALVLFTSENWCAPQGCPLAIFQKSTLGWRHVATINRVRPPIQISAHATQGWKDLWVMTGKHDPSGKLPMRPVLLKWGSSTYPGSTTLAPTVADAAPEGQTVIASAAMRLPDRARMARSPRARDEEDAAQNKSTAGPRDKSHVKIEQPRWY